MSEEIVKYEDGNQLNLNDMFAQTLEEQYKMLGGTINFIKQTSKEMREMYKSMQIIEQKAELAIEKSEEAITKLENNIFISDGEADEIHSVVRDKSIEIAKQIDFNTYFPNAVDFGDVCGRIQKGLWSVIRKKFSVSKYIKIKHIEYQEALDFANSLDIKRYLAHRGIFRKVV